MSDELRVILGLLEQAGGILLGAVRACPVQHQDELKELAWRVGNLAAKIDPWEGDETDPGNPFGSATERGN